MTALEIPEQLAIEIHNATKRLNLSEAEKRSFSSDMARVYHYVKNVKKGLGHIVDPLETLSQAKDCLTKIDSALSILEQGCVTESTLLSLALTAGVKPFPCFGGAFSKSSIKAMRAACACELGKLAKLGRTRHRSFQRKIIVDMAANVWKNNLGWQKPPPTGPASPFVSLVQALFSCLGLPGKENATKLIRDVVKRPCFTLYSKEQLLALGYLKPEDCPEYPPEDTTLSPKSQKK